ncbi:unnamed protein product [Arabis nemorensis]|uniref:Probable purine permease n=1 Tax=Arabis nemorensis TaxID=586526 RepID=A0A565B217_9BRAS|nr:unnamed protein product [Arabis nemorensis]
MGYNQPLQSNPQEKFVQIPLDIEHNSVNQTSDSNQRPNKWLTIIICIILAVTGQCIARLLENYYFLHRDRSRGYGIWTQSLLQVVGFPLLILPFIIFLLSSKKKNLLIITTTTISRINRALKYFIIICYMFSQAICSNSKHRIPFRVFTLIYTTQLLFTPVFSIFINKIKLNRSMIVSLILAILTGAFTLYTFSAGSPIYNGKKPNYTRMWTPFCAAIFFSLLVCYMRYIFEDLISVCNEPTNRKQPSFVAVFELLIVMSFFATIVLVAGVFISGENHDLKKHMDGFLKGEMAYVRTMVGQAVAWQVYWVGIVGLVFVVSPVFSTVISVCTWPVVSLMIGLVYNKYQEYHVLSGTALAMATLSVASYFYLIYKENN